MTRVLIADPIARAGVEILQEHADVVVDDKITTDALLIAVPDYHALIVRSRTKVIAPIIEAGTRLRVIGRAGVGLDNIDIETAQRRGIVVVNSPTSTSASVAEHTIGLMFALARLIPHADASLKRGEWLKNKLLGVELSGKTLGIIGLGNIGAPVAQRARGLGMRVLAWTPRWRRPRAEKAGARLAASLAELLAQSDFISLHLPLTPETRGLIGAAEIAKMKPSARLVNTARGGIVDELALLAALDQNQIAGAALDVFETEPPPNHALLQHPRVVVTPHIGAMTEEAQARAAVEVAEQVVKILKESG